MTRLFFLLAFLLSGGGAWAQQCAVGNVLVDITKCPGPYLYYQGLQVGAVTGPTASLGDVNITGSYKVNGVASFLTPAGGNATSSTFQNLLNSAFNQFSLPSDIGVSGSGGGSAGTSGLFAQQNLFGSTTTTNLPLNQFSVSMNASAVNALVSTLSSNLSVGSSTIAAQMTAYYGTITQLSSTGNKVGGVPQSEFVPFQSFVSLSHNEGGTDTSLGTSYGSVVGYDSNVSLVSGATDFYALEGIEVGVGTASGASVSHRVGVQIYTGAQVQGALTDAAIDIASNGGADIGFKCGVCLGKADDSLSPIISSGTMFGTVSNAGGNINAKYGFDANYVTGTIGGFAFRGASGNFTVDWSGNVAGASAGFGIAPINNEALAVQSTDGAIVTMSVANTGAASFVPIASFLTPNLTTSQVEYIGFGTALSTNNALTWQYFNAGAGSASNYMAYAFYGGNTDLIMYANGEVGLPSLPTSAGSGGLYVCIDTSGNTYKKSSCP